MAKDTMSRREFMRAGAGAAAISSAARVTLLEPARAAASPRPVPPSDRLRFASIGTGVRGCEDLATALRAPGVEIVAVSDLYDGRLIAAQEHAGKKLDTTKDYRRILDRKDIDFVIVATMDHWHARIVEDACAAGKDVYCEKPMTHKVEEGFRIIEAAQKYGRIVQVGSQRRSNVVFAKAREIVESGALGQITAVEGWIDRNDPSGAWVYPIPPDANEKTIDWERFLGDAPKRPFDAKRFFRWRGYSDYGEGLPGDLYVHILTGIYTVMGFEGPPQKAVSSGGLYHYKDGRDEPDMIWTLYTFPGTTVSVRCNLNNDSAGGDTRIYGTKGTLMFSGEESVTFVPQDTRPQPERYSVEGWPKKLREEYWAKWKEEHPAPPLGSLTAVEQSHTFRVPDDYDEDLAHMQNFLDAVRTRKPCDEGPVFGNWTATACHMANYSYFNNTVAIWDEQAKQIRS
ncbi:MAG TPA: Gfo/Idh/MocA family oxidoreductase [Terriglobia bacterium]|nr:Gfo/Idh/MocA family oxidoreductase [Terriglobia bacterium]